MATNTGMLRGRSVRENDLRNNRRDNLTQFYDDIGFSTTPEAYAGYMEEEASFQSKVADQQKSIKSAQDEYNSYKSDYDGQLASLTKAQRSMPSLNSAVNDSYNTYKESLTKIQVVGPGDKVESTYYLPKETAEGMVGQQGIFTSWDNKRDSDRIMNIMVKGYKNDSLHTSLRDASSQLESQYKAEASPAIAEELKKANSTYAEAASQLSQNATILGDYSSKITAAKNTLNSTVAEREAAWQALADTYAERSANMKNILGGLTIESAE